MTHNPPSLLELAARVIMTNNIQYDGESIPRNLVEYLNSGHRCVNSKCKGQWLSLIQSSKFYRLYHHRHRFSFYYNPLQYHRYTVLSRLSPRDCLHVCNSWNKYIGLTIRHREPLLVSDFHLPRCSLLMLLTVVIHTIAFKIVSIIQITQSLRFLSWYVRWWLNLFIQRVNILVTFVYIKDCVGTKVNRSKTTNIRTRDLLPSGSLCFIRQILQNKS